MLQSIVQRHYMLELKYPYTLHYAKEKSNENKFNVITTFSGGGGSTLGYMLSGATVLCALEYVEIAAETYSSNFNSPILVEDIRKISGKDLLNLANCADIDILDGSPPCSAFSINGSRESGWNKSKKYSTNKVIDNIEDLFYDFIRIAKDINPKIIVAENVLGLSIGAAKNKLFHILNSFEDIGYSAYYFCMDSYDYGAPQSRKRIIIVCIRKDIIISLDINELGFINYIIPKTSNIKRNVSDAFNNIILSNDDIDRVNALNKPESKIRRVFESFPKENLSNKIYSGSDVNYVPFELNSGKNFFNMRKLSWNLPSPTITTRECDAASALIHPLENRKLIPIELSRLMCLPDDYCNVGTLKERAERIGRMHCPFSVAHLANSLYENILSKL